MSKKLDFLLQLADNALINGHRLSEWCGHGPILEVDMALTNIALDQIGQARMLFQYATEVEGKGRTEDDFAFLRDAEDFKNLLLLELKNGDFAQTILRQFLFDAFNYFQFHDLTKAADERLTEIATKSLKEITYHLRYSGEWVIRLGDGTDESLHKLKTALDVLWPYCEEMFLPTEADSILYPESEETILTKLKSNWRHHVEEVFEKANLSIPEASWFQKGGKTGVHTEHLGFLLAEMQFLQRAYPGGTW